MPKKKRPHPEKPLGKKSPKFSIGYWKRTHSKKPLTATERANLLNTVFDLLQSKSFRVLMEEELLNGAQRLLKLKHPLTKEIVFAIFDAAEREARSKPRLIR